MESLNCSTNEGPHHLLRFKKEKVHMENVNLGYQGGLERSSDTYQNSFLLTVLSVYYVLIHSN